jgi:RNA polymerase sigma factor (sigma-70 family)
MDTLAAAFEAHRPRLRAVAYRMLGSMPAAEDAVQEAWLRCQRAGGDGVDNVGGWLTTIVSRLCLDQLRVRKAQREDALEPDLAETASAAAADDRLPAPDRDLLLADAVGAALLVVLEALTPAERVAFVLHDLFDLPFEAIAPIVDRTPAATRQLASRGRRRVRGASAAQPAGRPRGELVHAFLEASRSGNVAALLALLDPGIVVRSDAAIVAMGGQAEVRGADAVVATFANRARAAQPAILDGAPGLVWAQGGTPRAAFLFTFDGDRIAGIEMIGDTARLAGMTIAIERS